MNNTTRNIWAIVLIISWVGATIAIGWFVPMVWNWLLEAIAMLGFFLLLGLLTEEKHWLAIFFDSRKKISLSQFQMVLWTIIILSAYSAIVMQRIQHGATDPLAVDLPPLLWGLMGISTVSLVGSPLIKENKRDKEPTDDASLKAAPQLLSGEKKQLLTQARQTKEKVEWLAQQAKLAEEQRRVTRRKKLVAQQVDAERKYQAARKSIIEEVKMKRDGILCTNLEYKQANFTDIFTGEELGNCGRLDLGKVQMFIFTLIAVVSFVSTLSGSMAANALTVETFTFPTLSDGLVALLGISHAGYLVDKAVDNTQTEP
ncbi:MAG: hypothetical protein P8074_19990 [Anaerolineales bacterium]